MAAPTNLSEQINRLTGNNGNPENYYFSKDPSGFTMVAGQLYSTWLADGVPGPGAVPTVAANPDNTLDGAMRMLNPSGGRKRWLRSMYACAWSAARVIIYDRLFHIGGLSGTSTSAQTVGGAVTRYTAAESYGNFAMAEIYTLVGATQVNLSINYVDAGGSSRASPTVPFAGATYGRNPGACAIIPYNTTTGANSITSVADATLSATTGTVGNWGITICRPIVEIDIGSVDSSGFGHGARSLELAANELKSGACLGVLFLVTGTAMNYVRGNYVSVEN